MPGATGVIGLGPDDLTPVEGVMGPGLPLGRGTGPPELVMGPPLFGVMF